MAIRIPSRKRLDKYGYVQRGDGSAGGPLDVACPTLISPTNGEFVLQEQVTFSWGNVNGATSYNFYLWEEGDEEPAPVNTTSLTYSTTLAFGTTYRWRVNTVNDFGESSGCTYGLVFPSLPDGKSGYVEFEVTQGFISLEHDEYTVEDDQASVTINIIREGASGAASCLYATSDGTASEPDNYTETSGTSTWSNGVSGAFPVSVPIEPLPLVEELAADVLYDWLSDERDPRNPLNDHEYNYDRPGSTPEIGWGTESAAFLASENFEGYTLSRTSMGWITESGGRIAPYDVQDAGNTMRLTMLFQGASDMAYLNEEHVYGYGEYTPGGSYCGELSSGGVPFNTMAWMTVSMGSPAGLIYRRRIASPFVDPDPTGSNGWLGLNNCANSSQAFGQPASEILVRRVPVKPPIPREDEGLPDWEVAPDDYWFDSATGMPVSKEDWVSVSGDYLWLAIMVNNTVDNIITRPLGPVYEVGDPAATQAAWEAAYNAAVLAGTIAAGKTYQANGLGGVNTYPRYMNRAWRRTYKQPLSFSFGISNAVGATLKSPTAATVYILPAT